MQAVVDTLHSTLKEGKYTVHGNSLRTCNCSSPYCLHASISGTYIRRCLPIRMHAGTRVYVCMYVQIYAGTRNTLPLQARRLYYTCITHARTCTYTTRPPRRWMNVHVYVRFPSSSSFFLSSRLQKLGCVNACMHGCIIQYMFMYARITYYSLPPIESVTCLWGGHAIFSMGRMEHMPCVHTGRSWDFTAAAARASYS
jgi:hypothetical protein